MIFAVLGDEKRRERYDKAYSTENIFEDDISDLESLIQSFSKNITVEDIKKFKQEYQNSEEEKSDVIAAYLKHKGDMDLIFDDVLCCSALDDEDRFRKIIIQAIEDQKLESFDLFLNEPKEKRESRVKLAESEAKEASLEAKKLKVDTEEGLKTAIEENQKKRAREQDLMIENIEKKKRVKKTKAVEDVPLRRSSRSSVTPRQTPKQTPKSTPAKPLKKTKKSSV